MRSERHQPHRPAAEPALQHICNGKPSPGWASASCTTTTNGMPGRRRAAAISRSSGPGMAQMRASGAGREPPRQRAEPERRAEQPAQETAEARIGRHRQARSAAARRRADLRLPRPATTRPTLRQRPQASASSAAKRGPAPRRPHCQTSTSSRKPRRRSAAASGPVPSRCVPPPAPRRRGRRASAVIREPPQCGRRFVEVRLGPDRSRRLEHLARIPRRHQPIAHQRRISASMNSMLPDQPVAITARPSSIASAGTRPKPSLRCSDSTMSAAAVRAWLSPAEASASPAGYSGHAAPPRASRAKSSGKCAGLPSFSTSSRSGAVAERRAEGGDRGSGFLRSKEEARLKDTSTTTAPPAGRKRARSSRDGAGGAAASGGGTTRTRPGSSVSIAAAVKRDGTQASCTNRTPVRHSRRQRPAVPRPSSRSPAARAATRAAAAAVRAAAGRVDVDQQRRPRGQVGRPRGGAGRDGRADVDRPGRDAELPRAREHQPRDLAEPGGPPQFARDDQPGFRRKRPAARAGAPAAPSRAPAAPGAAGRERPPEAMQRDGDGAGGARDPAGRARREQRSAISPSAGSAHPAPIADQVDREDRHEQGDARIDADPVLPRQHER